MGLNDIQMSTFSEGSTSTAAVGRVDELSLPVDNSRPSRSPQADANFKDLDVEELNLEGKGNVGAGSSGGGSSEDDELVDPVSESRSEAEVEGHRHVPYLEPIREEDEDSVGVTHQTVEDPENTDRTKTVLEESESADHICRSCGPDEEIREEPDNLLVKLGCHCRGDLSRMHRKCILEWYGRRIFQERNYQCELCKAFLHGRIERIVFCALIGQESGKDILIKALGRRTPRRHRPHHNAIAETQAPQAYNGNNDHPDYQQIINVLDITQSPARQPHHPTRSLAWSDWPESRSSLVTARSWFLICVVICTLLVLVGLGVAGIGSSQ